MSEAEDRLPAIPVLVTEEEAFYGRDLGTPIEVPVRAKPVHFHSSDPLIGPHQVDKLVERIIAESDGPHQGGISEFIHQSGAEERKRMAADLIDLHIKDIIAERESKKIENPGDDRVRVGGDRVQTGFQLMPVTFVNSTFKPFKDIGYEYCSVRPNVARFGQGGSVHIDPYGNFVHKGVKIALHGVKYAPESEPTDEFPETG